MEKGVFKILLAGIGYFVYLLGGWNWTLGAMFIFMVSDYATGYIRSTIKGQLSSKVGYKGILKKCSYIFVVLVASALDRVLLENNINIPVQILGTPVSFRAMIICNIIATEGISILENLAEMGIIVPSAMRRLFKQLTQEEPINNTKEEKKEP